MTKSQLIELALTNAMPKYRLLLDECRIPSSCSPRMALTCMTQHSRRSDKPQAEIIGRRIWDVFRRTGRQAFHGKMGFREQKGAQDQVPCRDRTETATT
jgi:hypothetical protein